MLGFLGTGLAPVNHPSFKPRLEHYTSLGAFLLGTLMLIMPSGYSVGAGWLLLGSVFFLARRPALALTSGDIWFAGVFTLYALIHICEAGWDGQGLSGVDAPLRFLLAIPVMLLIKAYPPRLAWLWSGIAVGALGAGSLAVWQTFGLEMSRASGFQNAIQFGNLSMLLGAFCLAGLGWACDQPQRRRWALMLLVCALFGVIGSLLSGSRGGWIGVPFIVFVLYRAYGRSLAPSWKASAAAGLLLAGTLAYALPSLGVQSRINLAVEQVHAYVEGDRRPSSVGARFEMWRGASQLIAEKPILGWGKNGYASQMQHLADKGVIDPAVARYGHAHNQFVDAWAKRGLLGLVALLALYLIPMRLFVSSLSSQNLSRVSLAAAGVLLPVTYIDFSLTQGFLTHNSGSMVYAFWGAVLYGLLNPAASASG